MFCWKLHGSAMMRIDSVPNQFNVTDMFERITAVLSYLGRINLPVIKVAL